MRSIAITSHDRCYNLVTAGVDLLDGHPTNIQHTLVSVIKLLWCERNNTTITVHQVGLQSLHSQYQTQKL